MPLTEFQRAVLAVILANRSEASHFAGGMVLNAAPSAARYSKGFALFHDLVADLVSFSERDVASLEQAGFEVAKVTEYGGWDKPTSFRRAIVRRGGEQVALDWAHDAAFRFFPIVPDPLLGWSLHLFDMAVNKALALWARTETRDYVDIIELDRIYQLESIVWAACGKDEGFSPLFLLKMMRRFAKIVPGELDKIRARDLDPRVLKEQWINIGDRAEAEITRVADTMLDLPIGVAFVDGNGEPGWIGSRTDLRVHHGTIGGCWPRMHAVDE
jgi:hypothetical protein